MTASESATWTTSGGVFTPTIGATSVWTAPIVGTTCVVTATPPKGTPCSVSMTVVAPKSFSLVKPSDLIYDAGKAGSGFTAEITIGPTYVSFGGIKIGEGEATADVSGHYLELSKKIANYKEHPKTSVPVALNAANSGPIDTVGKPPPGTPAPFGLPGKFVWHIPEYYFAPGGPGSGIQYTTAVHVQVMIDSDGTEGTSKAGASRGRHP
jgi:hypothetical protein